MLPQHQEGVLTAEIQGYTGTTPYVRWGNIAISVLLLAILLAAWRLRHKADTNE
jgi:apolipoprotein N-acyltransferase